MQRIVLPNGLTIIWYKRPSKTITLEICVRVGSNNEAPNERGISHFIEHMLFEGTAKRPSAMLISNEIERIGGEFNAATTFERTMFYIRVLRKHFDVALDVLSDILLNPLFEEALVEKERKVILNEIKLVTDDPRTHQWVLFHQALFKKHPSRNPVYGEIATVKNIKQQRLRDYFNRHYTPKNIIVIMVGEGKDIVKKVKTAFSSIKSGKQTESCSKRIIEPPLEKSRIKKEKRALLHSYGVYGFRAVPRRHPDSYVFDVIRAHLGRGQSGRLFDEIRTKRGLAYDVGVYHNSSLDIGYLSVYFSTHKQHLKPIISIINEQINKLKNITTAELRDAKTFIEGDFLLQNEDNAHCAESLATWETHCTSQGFFNYISKIKKVTRNDIKRVAKQYLSNAYAMALIEQK